MEVVEPDEATVAVRKTLRFAANLQPLLVEEDNNAANNNSKFHTSALNAATPHIPFNHKLFTNRCRSSLLLRPATALPARRRHTYTPPLLQQHTRCSTAPMYYRHQTVQPYSDGITLNVPEVLHFESWWTAKGQQQLLTVDYHTAAKQFCVRSSNNSDAAVGESSGVDDLWLTMQGSSGQQLDHWDLHVGAQLDVLGRTVVLKKASCPTATWLDAWAKLLLAQKDQLQAELAKFVPVMRCQTPALGCQRPTESGCNQRVLTWEPTGGKMNLRNLREDVAHLAWRLRQHKLAVHLPPELKDLRPTEGPAVWSLPGASLSPQVQLGLNSGCPLKTPKRRQQHLGGHRWQCSRARSHANDTWPIPLAVIPQRNNLPDLGETPTALSKLKALNRVNPLDWLQGSSLASSAADSRNSFHHTAHKISRDSSVAQTPAAGRLGSRSSFSCNRTPKGLAAQTFAWNSTRLLASD